MVDLSIEIIMFEILARLPAKVVGRSKSVCKEWYALLSTQDFARVYCSRLLISSNQRILLIGDLTCCIHPIDFQTGVPCTIAPFPFNGVSIIHSHLDGLLCVCLNHTFELLFWNPVNGAYKYLSTPDCRCHGFFEHNADAIGLYIDTYDDYKVLHVKRRFGVVGACIYSRRAASWRNIPFITRHEYVGPTFSWSTGTLYGDTLYFTVCECLVGCRNAIICFDVNSEQFKEISFPQVPYVGIYFGDLVNVKNKLYMFVSTGMSEMSVDLWLLEGKHWIKALSCPSIPPIPLSLCCDITHFMTNGNWFVMTNQRKLYEIKMDVKPFECFYPVTSFRGSKGVVFVETLVSPTL